MVSTTSSPRSRYITTEERMWWIAALAPHLCQQYRKVRASTGHSEEIRLAYYALHEALLNAAFNMCSEGELVAARYHCEHILEEERLDNYHEACCHAILSTKSDNPAYHARLAYECFAEFFAEQLNGDRANLAVLAQLRGANWGLFGNVRRKEYDMMVGVARALEQEEAEQTARKVKEAKMKEKKKKAKKAWKIKNAARPRPKLSLVQERSEHGGSGPSHNSSLRSLASQDDDKDLSASRFIWDVFSEIDNVGLLQNKPSKSELAQSSCVRKLRDDIRRKAEEELSKGRTGGKFLAIADGSWNILSKFADAIDSNMPLQQWDQEFLGLAEAGLQSPLVRVHKEVEDEITSCSQASAAKNPPQEVEPSLKASPALDTQRNNEDSEQHPASPTSSDSEASVATLTLETFRHSPKPTSPLNAQDDTERESEQQFHSACESVATEGDFEQEHSLIDAQVATVPFQEQTDTSGCQPSTDEKVLTDDCLSTATSERNEEGCTPESEIDNNEDNDAMYNLGFLNSAWQKVVGFFAAQRKAILPGNENDQTDLLFGGIIVFLMDLRESWQNSNDLDTPLTVTDRAAFENRVNLMLELDKKRNSEYEQQQAYQVGWDEVVAEEDQEKALDAALTKLQRVREDIEETHVTKKEVIAKLERELDESKPTTLPEPQHPQEAEILQGIANIGLCIDVPETHCLRLRLTPEQTNKLAAAYPTEISKARQRFRNSLFKAIPTGNKLLDGLPAAVKSSFLKWDSFRTKGRQQEYEEGLHEHVLLGYHKLSKAMDAQIFLYIAETVLGPKESVAGPVLKENQTIVDAFLQHIETGRLSAEEMEKIKNEAPTLIVEAHKKIRNQLATGIPTGSRLLDELPPLTKTAFLNWDDYQNGIAGEAQELYLAMPEAMRLRFQKLAPIMAKLIMRNVVEIVLGPKSAHEAVLVPVLKENQTSGEFWEELSCHKENQTIVEQFAKLSIS